MRGAEKREPGRQSGSRIFLLACLIAEAFIDKIQHESTSHHLIFRERNHSLSCTVKHRHLREIKESRLEACQKQTNKHI